MPSSNSHVKLVNTDGEDIAFSPIAGYRLRKFEFTAAGPNYYQYVNTDGDWYFMKETVSGDIKAYLFYYEDASDLDTAWTDRASHSYDEFNAIF